MSRRLPADLDGFDQQGHQVHVGAFGGGLEITLACDFRFAAADAQLQHHVGGGSYAAGCRPGSNTTSRFFGSFSKSEY